MRTRLAAFICALIILAGAWEPAAAPKKGYDPFSGWATAAALWTTLGHRRLWHRGRIKRA